MSTHYTSQSVVPLQVCLTYCTVSDSGFNQKNGKCRSLFRYTAMTGYESMSYRRTGSLKMEFVLESWSNAVIYSANWISVCEGCRTDRNSRPGYSIRCMCNITARAVDMVQITPGEDVTTSGGTEIQTRLLRMKLCVM